MSPLRIAFLSAAVAATVLLLACPPSNTPQRMPPRPPDPPGGSGYVPPPLDAGGPVIDAPAEEPVGAADGAACSIDLDCQSGVCEGLGCDEGQGRCASRDRACTMDLRAYCGCDGKTFESSGSCPGARYEFAGRCEDGRPEGSACLTGADCQSGVCEGLGCGDDAPGTCAPARRGCTKDLRAYCGCDGKTFRASGSCPGRRYSAKGACKTP
jgi:hypothetical protein